MIVRVQIAGQELNPITIAPYIKGEKGDKGDPGDSAVAISTDPNNAATLGSDGKIFVPAQFGAVAESDALNVIVQSILLAVN
jgi:hypothetical protein